MLPAYRWNFNKNTPFFIPELITSFREPDTSGINDIGIVWCLTERNAIDGILSELYNCFKEFNRIAGPEWGDSQYKKNIKACNDALPAKYKFIACCSGFADPNSPSCVNVKEFGDCDLGGLGSIVVRDIKFAEELQTYFTCVTNARNEYFKRDPKKIFDVRVPSGGTLCDFNRMKEALTVACALLDQCIDRIRLELEDLPTDIN